jgi:hypothetical protein
MKESEWKKFKRLKEQCLERYCEEVLNDAQKICVLDGKSNHERYIELYQLMRNKDKGLGKAFDGLSRSLAHSQLLLMYRMGLVQESELDEFEADTVNSIKETLKIWNS